MSFTKYVLRVRMFNHNFCFVLNFVFITYFDFVFLLGLRVYENYRLNYRWSKASRVQMLNKNSIEIVFFRFERFVVGSFFFARFCKFII